MDELISRLEVINLWDKYHSTIAVDAMKYDSELRQLPSVDVAYILDTLIAYRNIIRTGNCNDCGKIKDCEYLPQVGEQVRINCPFYKKEETT